MIEISSLKSISSIYKEMARIIEESEKRKDALQPNEVASKIFTSIIGKDILVEEAPYFKELVDAERSIYVFKNSHDPYLKNRELLAMCRSQRLGMGLKAHKFNELMTILNNAFDKKVSELTEYRGYFILRSEKERFLALCHDLGLSPQLKNQSEEETLRDIDEKMRESREQIERINRYVTGGSIIQHMKKTSNREQIINDLAESDSLDLILLGLKGRLSVDDVEIFSRAYTKEKFLRLIYELERFQIFTGEDMEKIKRMTGEELKVDPTLDEILKTFDHSKNINISALKLLIPNIGYDGYYSLLEQLYKTKGISEEEYKKALLEFHDREMSIEYGVPFHTFTLDDGYNKEFINEVINEAKIMGMGESREEILNNLASEQPKSPSR